MLLHFNKDGEDVYALGSMFSLHGNIYHATMLTYCNFTAEEVDMMQNYFMSPAPIAVKYATHSNEIVRMLCLRNLVHLDVLSNDPSEFIRSNAKLQQTLFA